MHSHARNRLDDQIKVTDNLIGEESEPTSEQLTKASNGPKSKKNKKPVSDEPEGSDLMSLSIFERIEKRQAESLKRPQSLEDAVKENTKTTKSAADSPEALWGRMEDTSGQVSTLQAEVATLGKRARSSGTNTPTWMPIPDVGTSE